MSIRIWAYGPLLASICTVGAMLAACGFANAAPPPVNGPASPATTQPVLVADRATYLTDVRALLCKKWPQNRTVTVVCHGHSVPAGYFRTPVVRTMEAHPHLLHAAFNGFSTSRLYACDLASVIAEVSSFAEREWERRSH